jgi:hypothetical protein
MVVWVFTFILLPHPKEFGVGIVAPGKLFARKVALEDKLLGGFLRKPL